MSHLQIDLHAFFERYARTFHEDVGRFCDLYFYPSTTVRLDGTVQLFGAKEGAVHFFSLAKQKYENEGCSRWAIRNLSAVQLGDGGAAATVDWDMLSVDRSQIRGWRQTYNVIGTPGHWRVLHSTLHMGSERAYHSGA
jgi:hypothetical protein